MSDSASFHRGLSAAGGVILYRAAAGGLPIALGLLIAYRWGLREVAPFTIASAAIAVATVVVDWGGTRALPRDLARITPGAALELFRSANRFRLLLFAGLAATAGLAGAAGWVGSDVLLYLAILSPLPLLALVTSNALSERVVSGATHSVGAAVVTGLAVFALLAMAANSARLGAHWFLGCYVAGKAAEAAVMVSRRLWVMAVNGEAMRSTAAALWPFSLQMILGVIYSRLAVFTIETMTSREELGIFSVAVALQSAFTLIPGSLALVHFPDLTRRLQTRSPGVSGVLVRYATLSAAGVTIGVACLSLLVQPLSRAMGVPLSYQRFLIVFAAIAYLSIFSTIAGFVLQAYGRERLAARLSVLTLASALLYQVIALRYWGLNGIVVAVAAAELTTIALFGIAVRRSRAAAGATAGRHPEPLSQRADHI